MFVKTFKKTISLLVALVFILSLVPTVGMAEETGETTIKTDRIKLTNYAWSRNNSANKNLAKKYTTQENGTIVIRTGNSSQYRCYAQLDLSGYEEILKNPGTSVAFYVRCGGELSSSTCYDFTIYMEPDSADGYSWDTVTWNSANDVYGLHTTENRPILYANSDSTTNIKGKTVGSDANKDDIIAVLEEGSDNSVISLYFYSDNTNHSYFQPEHAETGLFITYDSSEIKNDEFVSDLAKKLTWDFLSDDEITSAANDINLPKKFYGADVKWTSSDEDIINPSSGEVTAPRTEDKTVTLEATLSYSGISDEVSIETVPFEVTVPKTEPKTVSITRSKISKVSSDNVDSVIALSSGYSCYFTNKGIYYEATTDRSDELIYLQWDLSDYMQILQAASNITISIGSRSTQGSTPCRITVLPDNMDDWTQATLTYGDSIKMGMYTSPGLGSHYGLDFSQASTSVSSPEFTQAIKDAVGQAPDDGLVSFRIINTGYDLAKFKPGGTANPSNPTMIIEYYEEDLLSNEEFVAKMLSEPIPWSAVSAQDINNVVADLNLPETFYGEAITWESMDETVITSSGEVIIGETAKDVILKATVNGVTTEFNVTVPANKIAIKSENMQGVSSLDLYNYSSAHIYANDDITQNPDVFVATYVDGALVNLKLHEDVELKSGLNVLPSGYHKYYNNIVTKAIIVDDTATLNPLAVAK